MNGVRLQGKEGTLLCEMAKQVTGLRQSVADLIAPELSLQGLGRHSVSQRLPQLAWVSQLVMQTQGAHTVIQEAVSCKSRS